MLINKNANKTVSSNLLRKLIIGIAASILSFTQVTASELNVDQRTVSQGVYKKDLNAQQRKNIIEKNKLTELPDQLNGKASTKTRISILSSQNKVKISGTSINKSSDDYADFTLYGATSFLQEDYDDDGFYETLSVTFDADIYSYTDKNFGEVYALLYLSKNGGPWKHYFTTDTFIIEGDSDVDEYEVISTFISGYETDHYDVLIDLYQVGYSDIAASLSADNSEALYALPIESADYNEPYVEVIEVVEVVEVHGGSIYWLILILLSIVVIRQDTKTI